MRSPQERTMRDLYDRTRHKDLAAPEEPEEGHGGGRAVGSGHRELVAKEAAVRKRLVSSNNTHVKAESGTCNVCYAPCSSCLHRIEDSNAECASSQTCSTRSEVRNNSLVRSEKGLRNKGGENDDEFSATSGHVFYSVPGGNNKVFARSSIADDSSEVDMPAKRRRLLNQDTRQSRAEHHDDSNSCVTGTSAEGKLRMDKKKLSTSASSRDLTANDYKDSMAYHSRLIKQCVDESKKESDVHVMHPSSSGRLFPADSPSILTKKLLRTQSSVCASNGLSPKKQPHEFGKVQDNLPRQPCEMVSVSKNDIEQPRGGKLNPRGDSHDMLSGYSNRNANKVGFSSKDVGNDTSCSKDEIQEHAGIQSNNCVTRNEGDKQDWDQDCSMDISSDGKLNIQHDVMTDYGNSEGLIDVNVCDICGDVGREYLLASCTRCLEGAEHTYCMRVKLDKVPDGEWLCEECQLREDQNNNTSNYGVMAVDMSEGKNQNSESRSKPKALQIVVPELDAPQSTCSTPTADQCDSKNKKLHLASADTQTRQVKVTTPAAERLDVKSKKLLSIANRNKLQVLTSDLDARPHTYGTPTAGGSNKKSQSSEFSLNCKKLRVSTDMESPLSSEGLRSPPISCKRQAENTQSPKRRLFKTDSFRKHDAISHENSFKKSNTGGLTSVDNAPVRNTQAVKSSQALSRSYSLGNMVNAKTPVPLPRGLLSKQLSFNSTNNGPKVKQLAEGVASKLGPAKHSPRDPRDKGPIRKLVKSGSFKREGSVYLDAGSSKQKKTFHLSHDEKPGALKSVKEKNLIERRASFSFKKPNIPSSPRPDSCMKLGERKIDQDISRSGPSILKSSKRPEFVEKKQSSDLSKSDDGKQDANVHPKQMVVISGKDDPTIKMSDPPVPSQCVKNDSSNDAEEGDLFISIKNDNIMPNESAEAVPTIYTTATCESDLQDLARARTSEDSAPKVICFQQKLLESTTDDSCKIVVAAQASGDILNEISHGVQMPHNLYPCDNKSDKPDLEHEAFVHQSSALEILLRDLVIPEQSYIWQGSFVVSRHGNPPEMFDGFQAYLSTSASSKAREVGEQLPDKIQLTEVPRHSSLPLQFKDMNPTEDNIALFFFAKDAKSYEMAYGKLLENMRLGDLSLAANISGTELLIFPSDKLPERIQRWNGLLFFWGIFYTRKASSPLELPVTSTTNCPLEQITGSVIQHDMSSPKALQSLGIDLNECPNDEISDPAISLGSEIEKSGASVNDNILLESKDKDRMLNASEIYHEETAGTKRIIPRHPTADPCGTHPPTVSTGDGHDMIQDYPTAAKGSTGTTGRNKMEEDQNEAIFCVAQQPGAIRSISDEIKPNTHGLLPSIEVSQLHFIGSKICDGPSKSIRNSDMGSLDPDLTYKRQKTSYGKHPTCSFGDEMPPSKCLSKIHPLPSGEHNPFDDLQYSYRGPSDPGPLKKPVPDHIIHVLSSDDEDSREPSTSLNKASLKADESSSLLSLSLSRVATKHNLSGSDIVDDEPLSLSLGLPSVVEGSRALEMKQFLPEKPGINT